MNLTPQAIRSRGKNHHWFTLALAVVSPIFWIHSPLTTRPLAQQTTLQPASGANSATNETHTSISSVKPVMSVSAAREQARLLHQVYATTLEVMHEHFFRRDGPVLPARAMEDIFSEVAGSSGIYANWIAVNTKAMSVNHEPKTTFEKQAADALGSGKKEYESIGKSVYRRAAPIPLRASCVSCHTKMFSEAPKTPRFAALVISVPLSTNPE